MVGRYDFAIKGLYLVIPTVLASGLAIWKANLFRETSPALKLTSISPLFSHLAILFVTLYLISLCLLVGSVSRPLTYFVLMGIMAMLILVEILAMGWEHAGQRNIIVLQIACMLASSVFGQTLKLPLYHGDGGDLLYHMRFIDTIVESGYVIPTIMEDYQYFPLFHIFGASATMLTGMKLQTSYFISYGIVFIVSVPIVYLLATQATRDARLPLVAILLYSLSGKVISSGMYMVPRTMTFVFFLLVLFLLMRRRDSLKFKAIAVFLILPFVLMHQTTLAITSAVFVALLFIELVVYRRARYMGYVYPTIFTIAYLSYWLYIANRFFINVINTINHTTEPIVIPSVTTQESLFVYLLKYSDLAIMAFLAIVGSISQLYKSDDRNTLCAVFALFSFMAMPFYFPGPAGFCSSILLSYRLPIMLSPFIAFTMAGGILFLVQQAAINRKRCKSMMFGGLGLILVYLFCFVSIVILGNQTDFTNSNFFGIQRSGYFTVSELEAFSFCDEHVRRGLIYTDYNSYRYMTGRLYMQNIITSEKVLDSKSIEEGYMLFRVGELESRKQLPFLMGHFHGFMGTAYIYHFGDTPDIEIMWNQENKMFDNGSAHIYSIC